jgi:aspartate aminotransferase
MQFSKRIEGMQLSPVRRLIPYSDEAKARGKKIYHLNIGQPDIKTPESFMQSIRDFKQDVLAYAVSQGENPLRDAISKYYKNFDIGFERGDILITNGGS